MESTSKKQKVRQHAKSDSYPSLSPLLLARVL